ncbi:T-cell immunoglobulin and mucin domain-containing protein 4-like isoform X2 [Simochromis diagramma]|uniref:T-cell immunoglobulin and mucin domain-containing protein 4-like isoform X2 n=1 Tax=Simochromis diagramma TaxID=43689 RepID=UPI001A7E54F3|nr:T-cell immunoglobulin and mucin domain-containing protein 4-like isoform X2 [Simochromis diagramma]
MRGLFCFCLWILIRVSFSTRVTGLVGHNVTLTCGYDTKTHGVLSFCWGKDRVPTSKCSNTILSSTGEAVSNRRSSRYQLLGRVTNGDLSLTILNAQTEDAGVYGCRVEIPGWFNDHKVNIELIIEEEQPVTQNYIISTAGTTDATEILTASASESVEVGHQQMDAVQSETEQVIFFSSIWNIGRMAGLLLLTIIIILCFIFRRMFLMKEALKHHNSVTAENIYECIAMT